ncbi:phosphoglycerate kinase [Pseudopelagicola sp. nBUS_20]|uniref:phosphoglycerate kinase n=1 Tax=Pseudopelagicola sp. nBUS_20 TaxID=3395317 RepID=UPI003EC13119
MPIRSILDVDVTGKKLVVRADLNVPVQNGKVTDNTRIDRFGKGMKPLIAKGARLIILTHMGRPDGSMDPSYSVDKLRPSLSAALGTPVHFSDVCSGPSAEIHANSLKDGEVLLCENVRYVRGEETNEIALAEGFAQLGDIYVNDAFSCAHRAHASTEAIARLMPAFAGPLMLEELGALQSALDNPKRPSVAIVGGAKISSKIEVLKNLVVAVDHLIVGGGMANTFLLANGAPLGKSLNEPDHINTVKEITRLARLSGCTIHLPPDVVVAREFVAGADTETVDAFGCPKDAMILDAGPNAVTAFSEVLDHARTILWNGPLGAFEIKPFDAATVALARKAAALTVCDSCVSVAGGGDTVSALNTAGVTDDFTYVSSAGGAFLEWLEGRTLPGVAALMQDGKV